MAEQFYTILTKVGKAKIANAAALGTQINLVKFHVGDGNGSYYSPTEEQTQLKNKVWEGNISSIRIDDENPNWIILESVIPGTDGGFMVREVGAVDAEGNLIAIGKFPETYKPVAGDGSIKDLILKMVLEVSNTSSVTLKIDPTVILASKKDVLDLEKKVNKIENTVNTLELVDTKVKLTDSDNLFEFEGQPNINQAILANKTSILSLEEDAGNLTNLQTNNKASLVAAINEVFQSANNGKDIIANAIGSPLVNSDTFAQMGIKIDTLTQNFKDILKEKGLEVIPSDKMLSLIEKAKELARRGSGYLPNQPFTCELGYMDLPQKFIFMHYYDDKMKLFCRDDSRRGDIYYNTIDLKTGVSDGWQKTNDSNLGTVINSYKYPIRGKHSENNWVARETSSGARYRKVDSSTFATTQITELNDCVTTRTSAIYRVGDILYYFKVTSSGTGIYVKLNSYDLTTNILTELYDFKSQLFSIDPKSITVDGDNLYFHLSKQGENRNVYFYKYSLSENSLEELGVAQVNDINLNLLKGSYIIYKKDKLYVISGYLTGDSNRCKILEFDIQSKLYKSHIFSLGHSSLGPNMSLENYVTGDNENIWLTGITSLETDTLFLRLNIN